MFNNFNIADCALFFHHIQTAISYGMRYSRLFLILLLLKLLIKPQISQSLSKMQCFTTVKSRSTLFKLFCHSCSKSDFLTYNNLYATTTRIFQKEKHIARKNVSFNLNPSISIHHCKTF